VSDNDLVFFTKAAAEVEAYTGRPVPAAFYNALKRAGYSGQFHAVKVRGAVAFPRAELCQVCSALGLEPQADQAATCTAA